MRRPNAASSPTSSTRTPEELQSAIDITLQRFTEYHSLQGAFGRRALIEQAKGILMARHAIDADKAFEMLRNHSQHNGHKLAERGRGDRRQPSPAAAANYAAADSFRAAGLSHGKTSSTSSSSRAGCGFDRAAARVGANRVRTCQAAA